MEVEKVKHTIWAADMNRALTFYRDLFGGTITRESEIVIQGAIIGIHGGGEGGRTWTGLTFQVPDLAEAATELVAAGGELLREKPCDEDGEAPHLAMCADPEGNELMLIRQRQVSGC